ncbi:sialin-like, partial [Uloborus diversus]
MTFLGMGLVFSHRVCFNVALVAMVNSSAELEISRPEPKIDDHCPMPESGINSSQKSPITEGTYPWTPSTQGVMLASYFYGYVIAQIVGGRLAELLGAKWLLGVTLLASSCLTSATPLLCDLGPVFVITLRVLLGLIHGMMYPGCYALLSRWAPAPERSTLLSVCVIGTHFGVVVGMPLTGYMSELRGWPSSFYLIGGAGFAWCVFWLFLVYETPAEHPRISISELDYIQKNIEVSNCKKRVDVPWMKVVTSGPVWAVTIAKFCGAWSFICFQSKLPAYLDEVLHMPIQKNGMVNSLLFGVLCVSIVLSGKASDLILSKTKLRRTVIRKAFETVALVGPACCMVSIPVVRCDADAVVALLTGAMALFGLCGGGDVSVVADMTPDFAGKIFGVSNAIASVPGILSPVLAGYFLEGNKGDINQWNCIFYISMAIYLFGAVTFLLFGSAEVQSWGTARTDIRFLKERTISTKERNLTFSVPIILSLDLDEPKK